MEASVKKLQSVITPAVALAPWDTFIEAWTDTLEHSLRRSEQLQASLWEHGVDNLKQFRMRVDQNLATFQVWGIEWQRQHNELMRWMAGKFGNGSAQ